MPFSVCILDFATPINNVSRNLLKLFHNLLQSRILLMTHTQKKIIRTEIRPFKCFIIFLSEQMRLRHGMAIAQESVHGKKFLSSCGHQLVG